MSIVGHSEKAHAKRFFVLVIVISEVTSSLLVRANNDLYSGDKIRYHAIFQTNLSYLGDTNTFLALLSSLVTRQTQDLQLWLRQKETHNRQYKYKLV